MRITNGMMVNNTLTNINGSKNLLDQLNTQMTTQKKISRPSEDPVVAIRALRLRTNLSVINQYYEKNVPDAGSWLSTTDGALTSIEKVMGFMRDDVVAIASNKNEDTEYSAVIQELEAYRNQIYAELNLDYAGRSLFAGYKTKSNVTFTEEQPNKRFQITQKFAASAIHQTTYISNKLPNPINGVNQIPSADAPKTNNIYRMRLGYDKLDENMVVDGITFKTKESSNEMTNNIKGVTIGTDGTVTNTDQNLSVAQDAIDPTKYVITDSTTGIKSTVTVVQDDAGDSYFSSEVTNTIPVTSKSFADHGDDAYLDLAANEAHFIPETGEIILGEKVANSMMSMKSKIGETPFEFTYTKTGFDVSDICPETFYDCIDMSDPANPINYTKTQQDIKYTINFNQSLKVNTEASDFISADLSRDIDELIEKLQAFIDSESKVAKIETMMKDPNNAADLDDLQTMLDAANKEKTLAEDDMVSTFQSYQTKFDGYLDQVSVASTDVGGRVRRLELTETRLMAQQMNFEELKNDNENMELSTIVIRYSAAELAYNAALTAGSKVVQQSLLNFI